MRNKKVFMIHGFEGTPNGGWRSYLMSALDKKDVYACSLSMPNPSEPILKEWIEEIQRYIQRNSNDDIYLVGHSLGGTVILRYIEQFSCENIKGALIVSAPCHPNGNDKIQNFLSTDFDWSHMKGKISSITVIHGDNDTKVSPDDAKEISNELDAELVIIPNGQHLNGSAGFTQLPEALDALTRIMKL